MGPYENKRKQENLRTQVHVLLVNKWESAVNSQFNCFSHAKKRLRSYYKRAEKMESLCEKYLAIMADSLAALSMTGAGKYLSNFVSPIVSNSLVSKSGESDGVKN